MGHVDGRVSWILGLQIEAEMGMRMGMRCGVSVYDEWFLRVDSETWRSIW